jgi:hypothetical protein
MKDLCHYRQTHRRLQPHQAQSSGLKDTFVLGLVGIGEDSGNEGNQKWLSPKPWLPWDFRRNQGEH